MTKPYVNNRESQLDLDGRMPLLHWPRYRPTNGEVLQFIRWCWVVVLFVVAVGVSVDALRLVLLVPIWPLALDIGRWVIRVRDSRKYLPKLWFLWMPFCTVWLLGIGAPFVAHHISPVFWYPTVIGIVVWRLIRISQKIAEHYIDYSIENESLSEATRTKWRQARESNWLIENKDPAPANELRSDAEVLDFRTALAGMRSRTSREAYVVALAAVIGIRSLNWIPTTGVTTDIQLSPADVGAAFFTILVLPVILSRWLSRFGAREVSDSVRAIEVFVNSPPAVPSNSRAPWSPRSRYGDAENRRSYLVWNVLLIGLLLLSATVFYPLCLHNPPGQTSVGHYPVVGTAMFVRFQQLLSDSTVPRTVLWGSAAMAFIVIQVCVIGGITALIGPAVTAANRLFEGESSLESEHVAEAEQDETRIGD